MTQSFEDAPWSDTDGAEWRAYLAAGQLPVVLPTSQAEPIAPPSTVQSGGQAIGVLAVVVVVGLIWAVIWLAAAGGDDCRIQQTGSDVFEICVDDNGNVTSR